MVFPLDIFWLNIQIFDQPPIVCLSYTAQTGFPYFDCAALVTIEVGIMLQH